MSSASRSMRCIEPWNRRPRAFAHADRLAQAVDLDMAAAGWKPTMDNFLGRVTKARILQAVAEAKGQRAADRIEHLKKGDMAAEAETLLADTGWLPEPLRTPAGAIASRAFDSDRGRQDGDRRSGRRRNGYRRLRNGRGRNRALERG